MSNIARSVGIVGSFRLLFSLGLAFGAWSFEGEAHAQQMDARTGALSTTAKVHMEIESAAGSSDEQMNQLSTAIARRMDPIRLCWGKIATADPRTEGTMRLRVHVPAKGSGQLQITENKTGSAKLAQCVTKNLKQATYADMKRPATAFLTLDFQTNNKLNPNKRSDRPSPHQVQRDAQGRYFIQSMTDAERIQITVRGEGNASADSVEAVHRSVHEAIPALLDCRRRSSRHGEAAGGEISLRVHVNNKRSGHAELLSSSVENPEAGKCAVKHLSKMPFPRDAAGQAQVTLRFSENMSDEVGSARKKGSRKP